jgi:hypothetical protein
VAHFIVDPVLYKTGDALDTFDYQPLPTPFSAVPGKSPLSVIGQPQTVVDQGILFTY